MVFKQLALKNASAVASAATDQIDWRGGIKPSAAMDPHTKICISSIQPRRRPRAFFSGLPCVASRSPYELAAGRLHRCTMETCSARIELHTIFALAPWAISLKNALKNGCVLHSLSLQSGRRRCSRHSIDDLAFAARRICAANGSRSSQPPVAARARHAPDRRLGADTRGGCRRVHLGASALASRMDDAWTGIDLFFG